ncbi:type VI immunity family protein [Pseudomonas sp. NPDC096950]|uniref:type VI immunity family protein n=1 Tax=Pseudomonas sp. NPDC096950 TaxID=3364485 RepID=UPI00383A477B
MIEFEKLAAMAPDLCFELPDSTPVVKLGLIATIFFKEGYTAEKKLKVMECFRAFHDEFGKHLRGQLQDKYKKLTPETLDKAAAKILALGGNDRYELQLTSAASTKEAETYGISTLNSYELHEDSARSYIKIVLPWDLLQTDAGRSRYNYWVTYLCNQVNADHGYGGLSTILPFDFDSYLPIEFELAQKYSGLEVDSMVHSLALELVDYIKGVNWQTILGTSFVRSLGGEDVVRHAFSGRGDIDIKAYDDGLIIQAGSLPELGELHEGAPAAYVAVNRLVKSIRIPEPDQLHQYSPYGNCFEEDNTALWYSRFDREDSSHTTPSRIEAGQPCSVAGYWFSPAQSDSRRYFNQGEILPSFSGSNWGDTLWYWSGEK